MSRSTLQKAVAEIDAGIEPFDRLRAPGAGRPRVIDAQPGLLEALDDLVEPESRGIPSVDCAGPRSRPASCLRSCWRRVSREPRHGGGPAAPDGLQPAAPAKENEGAQHADRDAQFRHIDALARAHLSDGQPVISVDTKKKEVVGNLTNKARNGSRRANRYESTSTTSPTPRSQRRCLMASTTSPRTRASSRSATAMTPPSSPWRRSGAGGPKSAASPTPMPNGSHHRRCRRFQQLPLAPLAARALQAGR